MSIDTEILDDLNTAGRTTPSNIARRIGRNSMYVWQRLQEMTKDGTVKRVDKGLYEKGRE